MDFLFHMKAKLYLAKQKIAPSLISLEVKFLLWLKIQNSCKATIIQNHLDLNHMLLNYYKWKQIIYCKRFSFCQWAQITLFSNKIYIIVFPKRNFFDQWKSYCKKRIIYALKTCCLTKFYTPLIMCQAKLIYYIVYCVLDLGYFLYHLQLVSQIWTLQNTSS